MLSTETIVAGVGVAVVVATIVWMTVANKGSDSDADSGTNSSTGSETASVGTTSSRSGSTDSAASTDSSRIESTPSSSSGATGGTRTGKDTSTRGSTQRTDHHRGDTSPRQGATSADDSSDDDSTTRLYDPSAESQRGQQVWLHIEGERIEIPDGTAIGRELRRHLVDQGVSERRVLAVSRDHFMVRTSDGEVELQDLDSSGGTVLEGTRLTPKRWVSLDNGDEIVLAGQLRGHFEIS